MELEIGETGGYTDRGDVSAELSNKTRMGVACSAKKGALTEASALSVPIARDGPTGRMTNLAA